jgi:hypothetical protein
LIDDAAVRNLLDDLTNPTRPWRMPTAPVAVRALADLIEADLVVAAPLQEVERRLAGQHGTSWPARRATRADARVHLAGPTALTGPLRALLADEGVPAEAVELEQIGDLPHDRLLVAVTETPIRRDLLDPLTGPHFVVTAAPEAWQIGPFVSPGRSACVRCIDAARSISDPRLPWVIDQWARRPRFGTAPLASASQQLALALTVRDVLAWVDGETPASWSATVTVPAVGLPERTPWLRHLDCSCVWDLVLAEDLDADSAGTVDAGSGR